MKYLLCGFQGVQELLNVSSTQGVWFSGGQRQFLVPLTVACPKGAKFFELSVQDTTDIKDVMICFGTLVKIEILSSNYMEMAYNVWDKDSG